VKTCTKCTRTDPPCGFGVDRRRPDGLHGWCQDCKRSCARARYYRDHEATLAKEAKRRESPKRKADNYAAWKRYRERNEDKVRARYAMNNAIRDGRLTREPCHKCGNPDSHGHHHDYTKPFDVEWICSRCHGVEHRRYPEGKVAA
jgi:hypothetical protein